MSLVDNVDISLGIMDHEGRMEVVNKAWEERTGVSREKALNKRYEEFGCDPKAMSGYQALIDKLLVTGESLVFKEMHVQNGLRLDGFYVDASMVPMRDAEGTITGLLTVSIDVTEKVRARKQVEDQKAILESMIEGVPAAIALFDRDLRIVNVNNEWANLVGVDPETARGSLLYDVLPDAVSRRDLHEQVLAGKAINVENVSYQLSGEPKPRYFDLYLRPVRDASGEVTGMLSASMEVTARYELDRQKDDFIALASHELKTPITTIKGYSQVALRNVAIAGDERLARAMRIIDEKATRLSRLVDELLDVSRIQGGTLALHQTAFDLRDLAQEVIGSMELVAPEFTFAPRPHAGACASLRGPQSRRTGIDEPGPERHKILGRAPGSGGRRHPAWRGGHYVGA